MGETRVDLLHLLEDLRDAYPGSIEETILTEIVVNSLDSGATRVDLRTDAAAGTLAVVDDGSGMRRLARPLPRRRGQHEGARRRDRLRGVGIKLGLLVSDEVVTETRRGKLHVASAWRLTSRDRAPWRWVPPAGLVGERGTAVRLQLAKRLSPLLDPGFVEAALRRHFEALVDPLLGPILQPHSSCERSVVREQHPRSREKPRPSVQHHGTARAGSICPGHTLAALRRGCAKEHFLLTTLVRACQAPTHIQSSPGG